VAEFVTPEVWTVPGVLALRRHADANLEALVTFEESATYAELDERSGDLAARFAAAGVAGGDRVGLLAPNGIEWASLALGIMRMGAVLVPLSTLLRPPELLAQLRIAAVTHLLTVPEFRQRRYLEDLETAAPGLIQTLRGGERHADLPHFRSVWLIDDLPTRRVEPDVLAELEAKVMPTHDLVILFTSGSRGAPKGVIHTHHAALHAVASGLEARCIRPAERLYIPMPFFWTGGFGQGLVTALVAGATLLTEAEPKPARTLAFLERERATLFRGWPDQAVRLAADPSFARTDLSSLRDGSLGAVLPPERRPAPGSRANLFGMTETFGPYSGSRLDRDLPSGKSGSCGRPFEGIEVRIVDPETQLEVEPDDKGEIWVRGENLLRGICGWPHDAVFTADGFYRTGDVGRIDEEGYLWTEGRLDDMVKVKGATVYPSEVEAALRAVVDVQQAHVIDVASAEGQREIAALVISEADLATIRDSVRSRLSAFKVPTRWLITSRDVAPLLASGKVDKAALQTLLESEGSSGP